MRLAIIDPSLFTWPYDSSLAAALAARGHQVTVYGRSFEAGETTPEAHLMTAHFYRSIETPFWQHLPKPLFLSAKGLSHVAGMFALLRTLKRARPDVIHVQWTPLPMLDRFFIPALRRIAPTLLTVHDSSPFNDNPSSRLQSFGAKSIFECFDHLIVHTEGAKRQLIERGLDPFKLTRMPHGPLGVMPQVPDRATKSGPERPLRIVLFGRIKPYKGADVLVRAAAAMPKSLLERCRICIVGEPFMDMAPLQALIASADIGQSVELDSRFLAEEEVGPLLASADIIALPYRQIDASGVLMSSLAAGVPIVASRIGLFAELLVDGTHGFLTEVDDHLSLARALSLLVSDAGLRARMGANVRALARELPDWNAIAAMTERLYASLSPAATTKKSVMFQT